MHSQHPPDSSASPTAGYVGRFAPSPTGPLHFGSLVGALASYLDARQQQGRWLLRIEDIDPLREPAGAVAQILHSLEAHALHWDGAELYQSRRSAAYETALQQLLTAGHAYRCPCSRSQLAASGGQHQWNCRDQACPDDLPYAIRFRVECAQIEVMDRIQGRLQFSVEAGRDDFVLKRKEGFYAYQLAVVVDDAWQGISDVVRGSDLIDSLPWQILLQRSLNLPQPRYAHFPVITNAQGQKLSKQNRSPALDDLRPTENLLHACRALAITPPGSLHQAPPQDILEWAIAHWDCQQIPAQMGLLEADCLS